MPDISGHIEDETNPLTLVPAVNYLMEEAERHGLDETAHFLGVAIEILKEEVTGKRALAH